MHHSLYVLGLTAMTLLSACSTSKDAGAFIALSLSPEKPFIVPGKGSSCVSLAAAKATAADTPSLDVGGYRILYQSFRLQWKSLDALTITGLRATLTGSAFTAPFVVDFSETEIAALVGLKDLTIPATTDTGKRPIDVVSNSVSTKPASGDYAVCGLQIGGISIPETVKSFTAQVKLDLVGFSTAADGTQAPVRKSTTARAELF